MIQHKHLLCTTAHIVPPTYTHGGGASGKEDGTDGDVGDETIAMMAIVMMMPMRVMMTTSMTVHMVMMMAMVLLTMVLPLARATRSPSMHAFADAAATAPHTPSACDTT